MTDEGTLTFYVVFRSPRDYPGKWVVRRQYIDRGADPRAEPRKDAVPLVVADSLEGARSVIPPFLYRLNRDPRDVLSLFEVWL